MSDESANEIHYYDWVNSETQQTIEDYLLVAIQIAEVRNFFPDEESLRRAVDIERDSIAMHMLADPAKEMAIIDNYLKVPVPELITFAEYTGGHGWGNPNGYEFWKQSGKPDKIPAEPELATEKPERVRDYYNELNAEQKHKIEEHIALLRRLIAAKPDSAKGLTGEGLSEFVQQLWAEELVLRDKTVKDIDDVINGSVQEKVSFAEETKGRATWSSDEEFEQQFNAWKESRQTPG